MTFLTHTTLPALALAALMSVAQAQTPTDQDHTAHHPDGATTAQSQPTPAPTSATPPQGARPDAAMIGQGLGSGAIVQPGNPPSGGQPGMMTGMDQMRSMMHPMTSRANGMGLPFEHVEGRIAFLKAELKITDAQTSPWNVFADALRANAKTHQAMHEQMSKGGMPSSWPERLAFHQKALSIRLDALRALEAAAKPLYAVLSDEQKRAADQLLSGPMSMM